jgi:beta-lactam-binding protein with PASTA domain
MRRLVAALVIVGALALTGCSSHSNVTQMTKVVVPDVIGQSVTKADAALRGVGLEPRAVGPTDKVVMSQNPVAGAKVLAKSTVLIGTRTPFRPATTTTNP